MIKVVQDLLILQDRDIKIQKLEGEMREIPKIVEREKGRLVQDQTTYEAVKKAHKEKLVEAGNLRTERRVRQDTVEKLKVQMFETKKNDEYEALGKEVENYEEIISEYETNELELLEECDSMEMKVEEANTQLEKRKTMVVENIDQHKDRARVLMARYKEMKAERTKLTEGVDEAGLSLYERLWKSKGDEALSILANGVCGGCGMKVVASTSANVHADDRIVQCENCSRILYVV